MTKTLTLSELVANLSAHVDEVKNGATLMITEGGQPIATISPTVANRGAQYPFRDFDFGECPEQLSVDPAQLIIEEREHERSGKKYGF